MCNWRKGVCLLLSAVLLFSTASPVLAAEEGETVLTAVVRNSPYESARVIGQLQDGTTVTLGRVQGDYYEVDCYDMTGYIARSQILRKGDGKSYVNCKEGFGETRSMPLTDHAQALALRHGILALARKQLGTPYVYGGAWPGGFDCSGFLYYLYGQHGFSINRTASAQLQDGIVVAKEGLQVGDLVFFRESGCVYPASHVGVYAGNGQILHAGSAGIGYGDLDGPYFAENYLCARRIIHTDDPPIEASAHRGSISGRRAE